MRVLSILEIEEVSGASAAGGAAGCILGATLLFYGTTSALTAAGAVFGPGGAMIGFVIGSTFARNWGQSVGCSLGGWAGINIGSVLLSYA